jgi:hypothetical protein
MQIPSVTDPSTDPSNPTSSQPMRNPSDGNGNGSESGYGNGNVVDLGITRSRAASTATSRPLLRDQSLLLRTTSLAPAKLTRLGSDANFLRTMLEQSRDGKDNILSYYK